MQTRAYAYNIQVVRVYTCNINRFAVYIYIKRAQGINVCDCGRQIPENSSCYIYLSARTYQG